MMGTTALLVTDMQNAFCHRDGSFERILKDTELSIDMCMATIVPCATLVAGARDVGVPVFTQDADQPGSADRDVLLEKVPAIKASGALPTNVCVEYGFADVIDTKEVLARWSSENR